MSKTLRAKAYCLIRQKTNVSEAKSVFTIICILFSLSDVVKDVTLLQAVR